MSNESIRWNPLLAAIAAAPTNPPAGPDSTVRTGSRAAAANAVIPPLDCMTKIRGAFCFRPAGKPEADLSFG
jgi:hypothetical protein